MTTTDNLDHFDFDYTPSPLNPEWEADRCETFCLDGIWVSITTHGEPQDPWSDTPPETATVAIATSEEELETAPQFVMEKLFDLINAVRLAERLTRRWTIGISLVERLRIHTACLEHDVIGLKYDKDPMTLGSRYAWLRDHPEEKQSSAE